MNKDFQKNKGAALMLFLIFFMFASTSLTFALSRTIYSDLITYRFLADSTQSILAADAGVEDMAYRFVAGLAPDATEVITIGGSVVETIYAFDGVSDRYDVTSVGINNDIYRYSRVSLYLGAGASFNFGVQSGNGGFSLTNGSSVQGNVFSDGIIEKTGGGTATIYGDAISSGPSGYIRNVTATGTARARTIENSNIGGDAYAYTLNGGLVQGDVYIFEKIGGAVVNGSQYLNVPEQGTSTMPIDDEKIKKMKQDIIDTGTIIASTSPECISGEYFTDTDLTLGFVKIECDFRVKKKGAGTVLTLTGSIWVEGNIIFEGGPNIIIDSGVGNRTVPIIADNESNRATSSTITVQTGTTFTGSGSPKSYVLLLSQNNDAENGSPNGADAITILQSSEGDLLVYSSHGRVSLSNSVSLKEVTGYQIHLGNSAEVIYESGLVNLLFTSGPGGGFTFDDWGETY